MKIQNKYCGGGSGLGGGGGFRVDSKEELNFCENSKKKKWGGGRLGGVRGGGGGHRVDVNKELKFL